jgi:hypothetical protein
MPKKHLLTIAIGLLLITGLFYAFVHQPPQSIVQTPSTNAGAQSQYITVPPAKTAGCVAVNGLPDSGCTPGAIMPATTKAQICVSGYSSTVRHVPSSVKNAVYAEYGIASHLAGEYEVDHLISLELGGSNDIANLWPEAANPTPGFHQKDAFENQLHAEVCAGTISLDEAQREIATDWLHFYNAQ